MWTTRILSNKMLRGVSRKVGSEIEEPANHTVHTLNNYEKTSLLRLYSTREVMRATRIRQPTIEYSGEARRQREGKGEKASNEVLKEGRRGRGRRGSLIHSSHPLAGLSQDRYLYLWVALWTESRVPLCREVSGSRFAMDVFLVLMKTFHLFWGLLEVCYGRVLECPECPDDVCLWPIGWCLWCLYWVLGLGGWEW